MKEELPEDLHDVYLGFKAKTNPDQKDERYCDDKLSPTSIFKAMPTAVGMAKTKVIGSKKLGEYVYIFGIKEDTDVTDIENLESETVESDLLSLKDWFARHPPVKKWKASIDKELSIIRIRDANSDKDSYGVICDNLTVGLKRIKKAL